MSKYKAFKAGDRVRKKNGDQWNRFDIVTVDRQEDNRVYAKETGTWTSWDCVEPISPVEQKREELSDAMKLIESYKIGCHTDLMSPLAALNYSWYTSGKGYHDNIERVLDFHLPLKTAQQVEIERIETEMRKLADSQQQLADALARAKA